jgi:hypothetical protein
MDDLLSGPEQRDGALSAIAAERVPVDIDVDACARALFNRPNA